MRNGNPNEDFAQGAAGPGLMARMSLMTLARSGAIAGVIKLASAALSFLMFVVVAKVTDERQFGLFSAAYAGASLVSFFASMGQQSTVLRFWPQYAGAGDFRSAHGLVGRAILVALAGGAASSLLVFAVGLIPAFSVDTPQWPWLCVGAGILSFALGWTEFLSGAFRAKGALILALLPRDVAWRAATILAIAAMYAMRVPATAVTAMLLTAALLALSALPQTIVLLTQTFGAERGPLTAEQKAEFNRVTLGLWGVTSLPPALGQVSTLLVAAILGPEIAGAVFVADRTARLVELALTGVSQVLAPEISDAYYNGDKSHVQRTTSMAAAGSLTVALAVLAGFVVWGDWILAIFEPAYATPTIHAVLVVFGAGAAVVAGCGPVGLLLQLTGLQHSLLRLLVLVYLVGMAMTAALTWEFGTLGAAASIAGTVITWNVVAVIIARRRISINPSLLGLLDGRRQGRLALLPRSAS